jgi:hypothetical protein
MYQFLFIIYYFYQLYFTLSFIINGLRLLWSHPYNTCPLFHFHSLKYTFLPPLPPFSPPPFTLPFFPFLCLPISQCLFSMTRLYKPLPLSSSGFRISHCLLPLPSPLPPPPPYSFRPRFPGSFALLSLSVHILYSDIDDKNVSSWQLLSGKKNYRQVLFLFTMVHKITIHKCSPPEHFFRGGGGGCLKGKDGRARSYTIIKKRCKNTRKLTRTRFRKFVYEYISCDNTPAGLLYENIKL